MAENVSSARFHTPLPKVTGLAVVLSLVIGVILLAFAWPTVTAKAEDIPIGVVGPAAQVDTAKQQIQDKADGAVQLHEFDDRAAAVDAIKHRDVYGAIVMPEADGDVPEVLTASAANPAVAQLLQGIATQLQAQIDAQIRTKVEEGVAAAQAAAATKMQATMQQVMAAVAAGQQPQLPTADAQAAQPFTIPTVTVKVTDVVPLASHDERGAGLVIASFPMLLGGLLGGVLLSLVVKGAARRLFGVVLYSAVAGVVLTGILQGWFQLLQGSFAMNALALGLAVAAISAVVTGLYGLFGRAGLPIGAVLMMLVGNPLSASSMPVEFLLRPWGAIGQLMPPGAAGTLIRDLSYFPDADTSGPWTVLAVWTVVGLALTTVAVFRERAAASRATVEAVAAAPDEAPERTVVTV